MKNKNIPLLNFRYKVNSGLFYILIKTTYWRLTIILGAMVANIFLRILMIMIKKLNNFKPM